jgi:hypothetical protein
MTKPEKEKIAQAKKLLSYILTCDDTEITLATIEAVIEILDDLR